VTEKPTGNITVGAGYSQTDKVSLSGSIQQANAFGSGNTIGLDVNTASSYRTIALSQTNPYFTDDGIRRTYEVYLRNSSPSVYYNSTVYYQVKTIGTDVKFGVPISELDTIFFGIGVEHTVVSTDSTSPTLYQQYVADFGNPNGLGTAATTSFPLTAAWQRDSRDSALVPGSGRYQRANFEVSGVGTLKYYRATYQHQYFQPLFSKAVTLATNTEVDYGSGIGSSAYPVFKNYYAGGIGTVRGYDTNALGDVYDQYGYSQGGDKRVMASVEMQFPFFGAGQDRTLRWFTFVDGGQVYGANEKIALNRLRYSTGIGISWLSPIGPLKLSYGKALNASPTDKLQAFQFQIGTGF
jgi:outer membrane protein insertion porin family